MEVKIPFVEGPKFPYIPPGKITCFFAYIEPNAGTKTPLFSG